MLPRIVEVTQPKTKIRFENELLVLELPDKPTISGAGSDPGAIPRRTQEGGHLFSARPIIRFIETLLSKSLAVACFA